MLIRRWFRGALATGLATSAKADVAPVWIPRARDVPMARHEARNDNLAATPPGSVLRPCCRVRLWTANRMCYPELCGSPSRAELGHMAPGETVIGPRLEHRTALQAAPVGGICLLAAGSPSHGRPARLAKAER